MTALIPTNHIGPNNVDRNGCTLTSKLQLCEARTLVSVIETLQQTQYSLNSRSKLWDELHEISPKPRHRVTVKETYTFRPKKEAYVEPDIGIGENLPRERHNDGGRSKDYEVSHENPALNTAKHIHRTSSNADKLRQSPDKNFTYRYASPQYGKSRHNDTLYYDVPQHRISRHNVTDDDHAYYQSDWLREESHENIDGYVDRASLQAYSPSDSSSILYQRACKYLWKCKT